jgi:UDP-glucose 4-epimerase
MIANLSGCNLRPQHKAPRPGDIVHSLAGIQRAKEVLGFEPKVSFEEGLRQTFEWYRQGLEAA